MKNGITRRGFTLIEVLVVVLIIGVLAAVAVPQYQRAVLKSRYAALMPIAKALANSNEAYYLEHGFYADDPQELPVQGQQNYPDGTQITVADDDNKKISYVMASRAGALADNKYIIFQKQSETFGDVVLCEANDVEHNKRAEWLCKGAFNGTPLEGKSVSGGKWTGYVLSGDTKGVHLALTAQERKEACDADENCTSSQENGNTTTKTCTTNEAGNEVCSTVTYDTDGDQVGRTESECGTIEYNNNGTWSSGTGCSNTVYNGNVPTTTQTVCSGIWNAQTHTCTPAQQNDCNTSMNTLSSILPTCNDSYETTYGANGEVVSRTACTEKGAGDACYEAVQYTYDDNMVHAHAYQCEQYPSSGVGCTKYSEREYVYTDGYKTSERKCSFSGTPTLGGACASPSGGENHTYDSAGHELTSRSCVGESPVGADCAFYELAWNYTYSGNTQTNRSAITCSGGSVSPETGACSGTWRTFHTGLSGWTNCTGAVDWTNATCPID